MLLHTERDEAEHMMLFSSLSESIASLTGEASPPMSHCLFFGSDARTFTPLTFLPDDAVYGSTRKETDEKIDSLPSPPHFCCEWKRNGKRIVKDN
jgi:hypothetical protein